jgi:hypothetical protein
MINRLINKPMQHFDAAIRGGDTYKKDNFKGVTVLIRDRTADFPARPQKGDFRLNGSWFNELWGLRVTRLLRRRFRSYLQIGDQPCNPVPNLVALGGVSSGVSWRSKKTVYHRRPQNRQEG